MNDFFELTEQAGLTITHVAELLGVTKPTLYNWKNGRLPRSKNVLMQVSKIRSAVRIAVEQGLLPLNEAEYRVAERLPAIKKALVAALTK